MEIRTLGHAYISISNQKSNNLGIFNKPVLTNLNDGPSCVSNEASNNHVREIGLDRKQTRCQEQRVAASAESLARNTSNAKKKSIYKVDTLLTWRFILRRKVGLDIWARCGSFTRPPPTGSHRSA